METFTTSQLARFAADAVAQGRAADVFDYWCELGELIATFAIRMTGWFPNVPLREEHEVQVTLPRPSACSDLCEVCALARPLDPSRFIGPNLRARLRELSDGGAEADPVARARRLLALSALARVDMNMDMDVAVRGTAHLLELVQAVALNFESSWSPEATGKALAKLPKNDSYYRLAHATASTAFDLYVRGRQCDRWAGHATVLLRGGYAPPTPGEVERAFTSCSLLAQGRLFPGPGLVDPHPRYFRGSLALIPAPPIDDRNMYRLYSTLRVDGWWVGESQNFEILLGDNHVSFRADVAAWRRDRFPAYPGSYCEGWWDVVWAQHVPGWICDRITPGTSVEELQRKRAIYARAGIPWYWIVDMQNQVVRVLRLEDGRYRLVECAADHAQRISLPPFDSLALNLGPLFQDVPSP